MEQIGLGVFKTWFLIDIETLPSILEPSTNQTIAHRHSKQLVKQPSDHMISSWQMFMIRLNNNHFASNILHKQLWKRNTQQQLRPSIALCLSSKRSIRSDSVFAMARNKTSQQSQLHMQLQLNNKSTLLPFENGQYSTTYSNTREGAHREIHTHA